jgi:hypothetical protein
MLALTSAGAIGLGALSYRYIESPFLRPKIARDWWVDSAWWAVAGAAIGLLGVLTAALPRTDPIVSSIHDGERLVAAQAAPLAPTTTAAVTTLPPTTAVPTTATPATARRAIAPASTGPRPTRPPAAPRVSGGPPPGTVAVTAIGDSVMLGAARHLQARLGSTGYIDAKVSRQFGDAPGVAASLRSAGRLGEVVVVHLGTNGPPTMNQVDALMRELPERKVVFVTVRMPRKWEGQSNDTLRAIPGRYANARLADWYAVSAGHPEYFASDGVHVTDKGAQVYADLVGASLPPPPPPPTTTTEPPTTTTLPPPEESTTTTTPLSVF